MSFNVTHISYQEKALNVLFCTSFIHLTAAFSSRTVSNLRRKLVYFLLHKCTKKPSILRNSV